MTRKLLFGLLIVTLVALPLLLACEGAETPTPTPTPAPTGSPTPTPEVHWWDKFGEPQYGGTLTIRNASMSAGSFDPTAGMMGGGGFATNVWVEGLTKPIWTLDRSEWAYPCGFTPLQYLDGLVMESWEQTDPQTLTMHIRQGIHWHDKPPVNGRELVADDIQFNYDRIFGKGEFTQPNPYMAGQLNVIERVVAVDKYTVEVQLKKPTVVGAYQLLGQMSSFVAPEWVKQADPADWRGIIGTGPWMLTDFIEGNKMTLSRNPNYWGYDERWPENQLPYADTLVQLAIPDPATALAALRTGKLDMWTDMMGALTWQAAETLANTDPEIEQDPLPRPAAVVMLRCDTEPFTDINVRKALQLAIDRSSIIQSYYNNTIYGTPVGHISPVLKGFATPYEDWPQDLKDEYSYDPEKARQLLADAGYPNGFKTNVVAASHYDTQLLQLIKSEFMDIGVDMEIRVMDPATYGAFTAAGQQDQMTYSDGMAGLLWSPTQTLGNLTSAVIPQSNAYFNYDATFDAMIEQLNSAATEAEMMRLSREADLYAMRQHWGVTIVPSHTPVVWQPYVKGYSGEILVDNAWAGAVRARLWIDQDLKKEMGR